MPLMFVVPPGVRGVAKAARLKLYGVAFLVVIAVLLGLTVAIYNKSFADTVDVTLQASKVGNQLSPPADVKLRGIIVGEVRDVDANGEGATLKLALKPDKVALIPSNVEALLLPKTLFGDKYVNLVIPDRPSPRPIAAGDNISSARSAVAIETEKVFDDLLPVLQTLQPQKLAYTLNSVANALRGRGNQIGENLELVDSYFRQLNPHLPTIQRDFEGLADFAAIYADAAPDLLEMVRNFAVTNATIAEQEQQLAQLLGATTSFARTADRFLTANGDRLIALASSSRPGLQLTARYSPEFPCFLQGMARFEPRLEDAFGGKQPALHITLEVTRNQEPYAPGEEPEYLDRSGPNCRGLPGNSPVPAPQVKIRDGSGDPGGAEGGASARSMPWWDALASGYAGSPEEHAFVSTVLAPVMGTPRDQVPSIADLLFGPMARGTAVKLS